ncbi:LytR/AlgR family response regulator transcription factor [Urechidicola vernalis]|uniref:LytTR family DNA-binding domain-containing protein n=1 Tax=Urechidicola vernalis TaxID=3075600 RepID=A0ABU2Y219_9FLAO|nr:LytTR family DNA-binding domain-containing protein [Urechidicola sp. P050]MDT0552196.1 LytTR family DNA-binding domain-containing protein [Urechidicola sp. P050]
MKVIIVEDEKPSARRLSRMLAEINIETQAMLHSVEESVAYFKDNEHPDLIMLDIQLSDGLSFEIFDQVEVNSAIIFTTAYDEYALKAFKLNSIDYLLKPIDDEELSNAIDKFKLNRPEKHNLQVDLEQIKKLLVNPLDKTFKKRFTIKVGQHIKIVPIDEIECFYSENKGSYLFTSSKRDYLIDYSLEELETELDPTKFFRVSRKFYVNLDAIKDIVSYTNSRLKVILNNYSENEIIVSREKVKDFKKWIS